MVSMVFMVLAVVVALNHESLYVGVSWPGLKYSCICPVIFPVLLLDSASDFTFCLAHLFIFQH